MKRAACLVALLGVAAASIPACSDVVGANGAPSPVMPPSAPRGTSLDVLLVVDDSSGMGVKQRLLAEALPRLISAVVDPPCVDGAGAVVSQPSDPRARCPVGASRSAQPVTSIHLGVVTSSLGGMGSDACPDTPDGFNDAKGHLVVRANWQQDHTYLGYGFLAFDPNAELSPPGEPDLGAFVHDATDLVGSVGEKGCGYEMPLEAAYRFLADPAPYAALTKSANGAYAPTAKSGLDTDLLAQRARFLRPGSVLLVIILSDDNDCSVKAGGQWYAPLVSTPFYRGASVCATYPRNKCCYSCGLVTPAGCPEDPVCITGPSYSAAADQVNLKCFHQKERYGFSGLYPIARYVNAFTRQTLVPESDDLAGEGSTAPNPLFSSGRLASSVIVTAITGVPWKEIANDPALPLDGSQNAATLVARGTWERIAGDPDQFVYPAAPVMQESVAKRPGVDPSENGGDRTLDTTAPSALQYACTFALPGGVASPICSPPDSPDNPICAGGVQIKGEAHPALRELSFVGGLGDQGVVASICPFEALDTTSPAYGFSQAMSATVRRLGQALPPAPAP